MNKEQLTVAVTAAAAYMTAALADAEAAQRKMLEVDITLADLAAKAHLEEEQETQQATKKKAKNKHKTIGTGAPSAVAQIRQCSHA